MNSTTPIAKNHICISRALFNEGMRAVENQAYKKSVKKLFCGLIVLFAIVAAWLLYTGGSLIFLLGETIFLGTLLFWLIFMLPNSRRRSKYKAMTRGTHSVPERTATFYPEYLSILANDGKETIIQYNDIINWQETKNLYILNCQNRISILLDKNGFDIGNFDAITNIPQKLSNLQVTTNTK